MREVKFAVVREDPEIELRVASHFGVQRALLVASGGCTAFAFAHSLPGVDVCLYDFNPAQISHVAARADAIVKGDLRRLNVDDADPSGLSQCGAFERLFRLLRCAVTELVVPAARVEAFFAGASSVDPRSWFESVYWPAVFDIAFADGLLVAMFGEAAIQNAKPGSYPRYFQGVFERGLCRQDAARNPFLQHVLLGRYCPADAPVFLHQRHLPSFEVVEGRLLDVPRLERFDLVHLSNIFDWLSDVEVQAWCQALRVLRPGAVITMRQLNNHRDYREFLGSWFRMNDALSTTLLADDRSLFYNRIEVAVRTEYVGPSSSEGMTCR